MVESTDLGSALFALYADDGSDYSVFMAQVRDDLAVNKRLVSKNRKILLNLNKQVQEVDADFKLFTNLSKKRDKDKKRYDHYRVKLNRLR